jgi:hypothetical protein
MKLANRFLPKPIIGADGERSYTGYSKAAPRRTTYHRASGLLESRAKLEPPGQPTECDLETTPKRKAKAPFRPLRSKTEKARCKQAAYLLILVEDHSINEHIPAFAHVVDAHWSADFDLGSDRVFIKNLAAARHISDVFAEAVIYRPTCFLQDNCVARSE